MKVILFSAMIQVHPHACGDNFGKIETVDNLLGSPPRVWGQRLRQRNHHARPRFTPTRVGTTRFYP